MWHVVDVCNKRCTTVYYIQKIKCIIIIDLVHCNTRSSVAQNTTLVMIYKSQCFVCGFSINNRMCSKLYTGFATGMFNIEAHIATI